MYDIPSSPGKSTSAVTEPGPETRQEPKKVRLACTPCHSQKLRCVRKQDEASCERCLKLKKACRFAPRAARSSLRYTAQSHSHESLSVSAAWSMPPEPLGPVLLMEKNAMIESPLVPQTSSDITEDQVAAPCPKQRDLSPKSIVNIDSSWLDPFRMMETGSLPDQEGSNGFDFNQDFHCNSFLVPESLNDPSGFEHGDHSVDPLASFIRELGSLSVQLYEFVAKFPSQPQAGTSPGSPGNVETAFNVPSSREKKLFVLDEIFRFTSRFIHTVEALSGQASVSDRASPTSCFASSTEEMILPLLSNQATSCVSPGRAVEGLESPLPHMDEATMLMVMSCHCRLVDIYHLIFQMMQACIEHSLPPQVGKDWIVVLPQLQVGSLATPLTEVDAGTSLPRATTSMYMLLITMMSSQLCQKMADVMGVSSKRGAGSRGTIRPRELEGLVAPSSTLFDAMARDRTDRLEKTIEETRILLQRSSFGA